MSPKKKSQYLSYIKKQRELRIRWGVKAADVGDRKFGPSKHNLASAKNLSLCHPTVWQNFGKDRNTQCACTTTSHLRINKNTYAIWNVPYLMSNIICDILFGKQTADYQTQIESIVDLKSNTFYNIKCLKLLSIIVIDQENIE